MSSISESVWFPLCSLLYIAVMLHWVRVSARMNVGDGGFFSAAHSLAPWLSALVIAGASLAAWFVLGAGSAISDDGFSMPVYLVGGVLVALPGIVFFKRVWFAAERLRVSSQAEIFRAYFQSPFLVAVVALVAVLFAIGFSGLQIRAFASIASVLSGGALSPLVASTVFGFVLFAGVGIGGMRALGYFGFIQAALVFCAIVALAGFALSWSGGFAALNANLYRLAMSPDNARFFSVDGIIRFTGGLGRGGDAATSHTAIANLSLAFALMGFQASPVVLKVVLSTRSPKGFAAGQTWVTAGFFGALIIFAIAIAGLAGLLDPALRLVPLLDAMQVSSPWFAAWIFIGIGAGVQLLAGLSLFVAGETLVRHLYKPYFNAALGQRATITLTRVVIAVLTVVALVMQNLTPVTVSALAGLALPAAFQLWVPMLGVTWLGWITRPAAVLGVGFGLAGVVLTEPLGYQLLSFLGLELPWGRWPWTIHSAVWGMAANVTAVLIISAITNRNALCEEAREVRKLYATLLASGGEARRFRAFAWSAVLAWFFLAVGPGLIFGNTAFTGGDAAAPVWLLGMPSLWAWALAAWILGVGLAWFLSYKMEMASPVTVEIPPYEPPPRLRPDQSRAERERLGILVITGAVSFALVVLIAFSFGG
ncbi:MAG: hypothetical protein CML23_06965 [Rhizobiaceae bacterium]|nr:hypothetical protein [Rhizobiaceae bacterium]